MIAPATAGWIALGAGIAIALAFMALGIRSLVRIVSALEARVERYGTLPVVEVGRSSVARLGLLEKSIESGSRDLVRLEAALARLRVARDEISAIITSPTALVALMRVAVLPARPKGTAEN